MTCQSKSDIFKLAPLGDQMFLATSRNSIYFFDHFNEAFCHIATIDDCIIESASPLPGYSDQFPFCLLYE